MLHILTIHFKDKWVDIQKEQLKKYVSEEYKVYTRLGENYEVHKDKFDGALDIQDVKHIRVTNLDSSNSLTLSLQIEVGEDDSGADTSASILLEAGKSFMMGSGHDGINVSDANANLVTDLVDLDSLVVQPGGNAINVEVFVAST